MLADTLTLHAQKIPDKIALRVRHGDGYRTWTYAEVWQQARSAASWLRAKDMVRGDRVVLFADNSPEWILAYLGIHLAGGIVVPLDAQYASMELQTILGFAECRLMLCSQTTQAAAQTVLPKTSLKELVLIDGDSSLFAAELLTSCVPLASDDLMTVIYTSGTTGNPKGVCLSVGNIMSNVQGIIQAGIVGSRDTALGILPLHHCYALTTTVLTPLVIGADITLCASLRGPAILAAMVETGVSVAPCVPKVLEGFDRAIADKVRRMPPRQRRFFPFLTRLSRRMRRLTGWNPGRTMFPAIRRMLGQRFRFFASGGAKLDRDIIERLLDLGIRVVEGYGLTETSPVVSFNPVHCLRAGSVGLPLAGVRVKIANPDADGMGEVLVQGPNVMRGYDRRPEDTAQVLQDGWLHTGDLGFLDRDGYLFLTGRLKEVIVMASGKNIYPEDVERCYGALPLVRELCIMPVERPDGRVERLRAVIVPDFEELQRRKIPSIHEAIRREITRLAQDLPSYMHLTELKLVTNELPRTRLGKLRRVEIRRMVFEEVQVSKASQLTPEDLVLMKTPGADRLMELLQSISGRQERILPGDHLELDLGLDSLARVELEVKLEQDFGLVIPPGESADISTVAHLLRRLSGTERKTSAAMRWGDILHERVSPPLSELFDLSESSLGRWVFHIVRCLVRGVARWVLSLDVHGLERLPSRGPYLLCPTHASRIDAVLIFLSLPRSQVDRLFFLGAEDIFASPLMRRVARVGRVIPTATTDTILVSLRRAAEALSMGYSVCIFPEGAVTRDGRLQKPHPGVGILACECSVPVVPVLARGTFDMFSYAHPGFHVHPVGLTFGTPWAPPKKSVHGNADYLAVLTAWQEAISRLRDEDDRSGSLTAGRSPRVGTE